MQVNPLYKLLKSKSDQPTHIRLFLYHKSLKPYGRFVWGTGKAIYPELWNDDVQRPTTDRYRIGKYKDVDPYIKDHLTNIKTHLDRVDAAISKYFSICDAQRIKPSKDQLKAFLDEEIKLIEPEEEKKATLNQYIAQFIEQINDGTRLHNGKRYSNGTIKNYIGFQNIWNEYQEDTGRELDFDDITVQERDRFITWCNEKPRKGRNGKILKKKGQILTGLALNTVGRHIRILKTILGAAFDENLHTNLDYQKKQFKTVSEDVEAIYLTEDELEAISRLELTGRLEKSRDVFLCGCLVAQRWSDYSRLSDKMIVKTSGGNKALKLIQKKTGHEVTIPLHNDVERIIQKYGGRLPDLHEQKVNDDLKKIGKLAGINDITTIQKTVGGEKQKTTLAKHRFLVTHSARRTGATLMYLSGIPALDVAKITGHKTEKSLLRYIKIDREIAADRLAKNSFFRNLKVAN